VALRATINYIIGMLTNLTSLQNMYVCGAGIVAFLRIFFASAGIFGAVWLQNYGDIGGYFLIIIDTYLPFFVSISTGIVGIGEIILHFILYVIVGVMYSGGKYGLAT